MCPEYERHEREIHLDLSMFEMVPGTETPSGPGEYPRIDHSRAVKKYHRPAAGNEQPFPEDVRPTEILRKTMDYLCNEILDMSEASLADIHKFVRDRTRSIRQDFTLQNLRNPICVEIHEEIARFHIFSGHRLCEEDPAVFDAFQNTEQLRKVLQSLQEFYDDSYKHGHSYPNEAEFRCYYILTHLPDTDIYRKSLTFKLEIFQSDEVQFALKCCSAFRERNYFRFFRLLENATYLEACLLHSHFNMVRNSALLVMNKVRIPLLPGLHAY